MILYFIKYLLNFIIAQRCGNENGSAGEQMVRQMSFDKRGMNNFKTYLSEQN